MSKGFFTGVKKGMSAFGHKISTIINSTLLFIVYFIGVGITSIIAKLTGKKFLDLKIDKQGTTYWKELNLEKKPIQKYYRQF